MIKYLVNREAKEEDEDNDYNYDYNNDHENTKEQKTAMGKEEMLGIQELKTMVFYRRLTAEAIGTAILVIFGCGSAMTVTPPLGPAVISIAVAFGLTVSTVIWCVGNVSGAHINPCVTLAMFVTRKISLTRCLAYVIVQCVGGTVGAAILWGLTPAHRRGTLGVTLIAEEVTVWQGFLVEVVATFVLVLAIFATCDGNRQDHSGGSPALSIGLVVTMDIPWAIQYTGASMNPARSLGPCILTGLWQDHWGSPKRTWASCTQATPSARPPSGTWEESPPPQLEDREPAEEASPCCRHGRKTPTPRSPNPARHLGSFAMAARKRTHGNKRVVPCPKKKGPL